MYERLTLCTKGKWYSLTYKVSQRPSTLVVILGPLVRVETTSSNTLRPVGLVETYVDTKVGVLIKSRYIYDIQLDFIGSVISIVLTPLRLKPFVVITRSLYIVISSLRIK